MLIIERTSAAVPIIGTAGPVCRPALFLPGEVGNFLQADAAVLCVNSNVQFPVPVSGPEIFPAVQMRVVEESGYIAAVGTQVDLRAAGGLFVVNGSASVYCVEWSSSTSQVPLTYTGPLTEEAFSVCTLLSSRWIRPLTQ